MRNIFLLRHAKSSWKDTFLDDYERPLNNRGKRDAPHIAHRLLTREIEVDLIISSSSRRTSDTAKIFADILSYRSEMVFDDKLYEASNKQILEVINRIDDKYQNVLIVCHNPGITNVVNNLCDFFIDNIPTTGIVGLSFNNDWRNIRERSCSFLFFDYPKKYFS